MLRFGVVILQDECLKRTLQRKTKVRILIVTLVAISVWAPIAYDCGFEF